MVHWVQPELAVAAHAMALLFIVAFPDIPTVQIQKADPDESPSGFKLVAGDCEFAIGLED